MKKVKLILAFILFTNFFVSCTQDNLIKDDKNTQQQEIIGQDTKTGDESASGTDDGPDKGWFYSLNKIFISLKHLLCLRFFLIIFVKINDSGWMLL